MLAGTLDIASTILDRARIEPYNGIQGKSLMPLIAGDGATLARNSMVIEDDQQRAVLGLRRRRAAAHPRDAALAHDDRA